MQASLLVPVESQWPGQLLLTGTALQERAMQLRGQVPVLESLLALVTEWGMMQAPVGQ